MRSKASYRLLILLPLLFAMGCTRPRSSDVTGIQETYTPPVKPSFDEVKQVESPVPEVPSFDKVKQNETPAPAKPRSKHHQEANLQGAEATKMDILFVVDTSESMCSDQAALARNINRFVDIFLKNKKIDFHIGVTAAWDSKLFGSAKRKYRNGELRPVAGQAGQRYVTNQTSNLQATLSKTLHIGFEPYLKNQPEISGPESEELFSPALAAFTPEMQEGPNKGFRRADAHLAVVIVTDTEDSTPDLLRPGQNMLAQDVFEQLNRQVQSNSTLTVLAALARFDEMTQYQKGQEPGKSRFALKFPNGVLKQCNSYTVDPGIVGPLQGPYQIAALTELAKGEAFDLASNDFGGKMAKLGRTLVNKALSYTVALDKVPDLSQPMTVKINKKVILRSEEKGWSYDPENQAIHLNEGLDLSDLDSFEVEIDYTIFE